MRPSATGWPTAVDRYSGETSQAVAEGGSPKAAPIGNSATDRIVELIGFGTAPETIGGINRRAEPPPTQPRPPPPGHLAHGGAEGGPNPHPPLSKQTRDQPL